MAGGMVFESQKLKEFERIGRGLLKASLSVLALSECQSISLPLHHLALYV